MMKFGFMKFGLTLAIAVAMSASMTSTVASPDPSCPADIITVGDFYIVMEDGQPSWIYQEANGVKDLQRGGMALHGFGEDVCYEQTPSGNPTHNYDLAVY